MTTKRNRTPKATPKRPPPPAGGKNKKGLEGVATTANHSDTAKAQTSTSNHTVPPAETSTTKPTIRPGIIFLDSLNDELCLVVKVIAEANDVHVVCASGSYWTMSMKRVMECVEKQYDASGPFNALANHIAASFEVHPLTAPFAPPRRHRDIPIACTTAGQDFIGKLLLAAGLDWDSEWKPEDIIEELTSIRDGMFAGVNAMDRLMKLIDASGHSVLRSITWPGVVEAIESDYAKLGELNKTVADAGQQRISANTIDAILSNADEMQLHEVAAEGFVLRYGLQETLDTTQKSTLTARELLNEVAYRVESNSEHEKLANELREFIRQIEGACAGNGGIHRSTVSACDGGTGRLCEDRRRPRNRIAR